MDCMTLRNVTYCRTHCSARTNPNMTNTHVTGHHASQRACWSSHYSLPSVWNIDSLIKTKTLLSFPSCSIFSEQGGLFTSHCPSQTSAANSALQRSMLHICPSLSNHYFQLLLHITVSRAYIYPASYWFLINAVPTQRNEGGGGTLWKRETNCHLPPRAGHDFLLGSRWRVVSFPPAVL